MVRQVGVGQISAAPPPLYPPTTTNLVMHRVALAPKKSIWPLSNNTPVSTDQLYVSPGMWSWKERNDFSLTEDSWLHYIGQIMWEMVAFLFFMHSLEKTSAPIGAVVI